MKILWKPVRGYASSPSSIHYSFFQMVKDEKNKTGQRLGRPFFIRDVLDVAPDLPGKILVIHYGNRDEKRYFISEVEAYRGHEDKACHACRGRTPRTEIMYHEGGHIYMYLIYGMYWMLNIVTSVADKPQAVLIRGVKGIDGPGKLTRELKLDKSYYGVDLVVSPDIWLEDAYLKVKVRTSPRIGIDYAGDYWSKIHWRYYSDF